MSDGPSTMHRRPYPLRPKLGWKAWESTMGYISRHISPDVTMKIEAYPIDDGEQIGWSALLSWGQFQEQVENRDSVAAALRDLWVEVDQHNTVFQSEEDAAKAPMNYAKEFWLEERTMEILQRLLSISGAMFGDDWQLIIVYQPIADAVSRIQTRLLADENTVQVGGRGAYLREAFQQLYRNTASIFALRSAPDETIQNID